MAERFVVCLLRNEPSVLQLLARNPFPEASPQFVRATIYEYRFTDAEERKRTGAWWKREVRRQYLPAASLKDLQR